MFKKIIKIKDFGIFQDFSGASLPEFRQFNLIFGWNYSGKTTLSRVFQCLEQNKKHPDYANGSFSIENNINQNFDEKFSYRCNVRVFNEDFRAQNLKWDVDGGINPIFILGEENIELQEELAAATGAHHEAIQEQQSIQAETDSLEAEISAAETQCGATVGRELSIRPFDKRHVKQIYESFTGSIPPVLSDAEFATAKAQASATEIKESIPLIDFTVVSIDEIAEQARKILGEQVIATLSLPQLREDPNLSAWVEHGLSIHTSPGVCGFCQSHLTEARLDELNAHFSDGLRALRERVGALLDRVCSAVPKIDRSLYVPSNFYPDMQDKRATVLGDLLDKVEVYQRDIKVISDALKGKLDDPFSNPKLDIFGPTCSELVVSLVAFNELLAENNARTQDFDSAKISAISLLKSHYVVEAMVRIDRPTKEIRLALLASKRVELRKKIIDLKTDIDRITAKLSDAAKGADSVNEILSQFFGKRDLTIAVSGDGTFSLMRGERHARNLSEGERTAISFSYFIAKLSENGSVLSDTIVYIDDPISSLDANHLLNVNSIIKSTFYEFDSNSVPKHKCKAKQLFISTHNYEFFHLLWEWFYERTPKDFSGSYIIKRRDSDGLNNTVIMECPLSIRKYRSEYLFLFHQIKNYIEDPKDDLQVIFNLSNMGRRFMEGYLHFKFLTHMNIDQDIGKVLTDPIACERARKFLHYYSHTLNRGGGMKVPDLAEAALALQDLLDGIKNHDPIHYRALEEATE